MEVAVVSGGVGAARLLAGLVQVTDPSGIAAVVNVGDDTVFHGLAVCPDLDTITYTLAGAVNPATGWGLAGETWAALGSLRRHAQANARPDVGWFALGDLDLGTHLWRTHRLGEGARLTEVTAEIARTFGLQLALLPVTDDPLRTRVASASGDELAFQEYFVREHQDVTVASVRFDGAVGATPSPEAAAALADAAVVVIAPSNPVVSVGPVLAVPGVLDLLAGRRGSVVAVSPLVGGEALKGPAARLMTDLGEEASVVGVARRYAPLASVLVIDPADAHLAGAVAEAGMEPLVVPSVMDTPRSAATLAQACLDAVPPNSTRPSVRTLR